MQSRFIKKCNIILHVPLRCMELFYCIAEENRPHWISGVNIFRKLLTPDNTATASSFFDKLIEIPMKKALTYVIFRGHMDILMSIYFQVNGGLK